LKTKIVRVSAYIAVAAIGMFYGIMVHRSQLPPYHFVQSLYKTFASKEYIETPKEYMETDVVKLISIKEPEDVSRLRGRLIARLFGQHELPSTLPSGVVNDFTDTRYDDVSSLSRINKLNILMEHGLESHVYHFIPKTPNNKAILYHQGHDGDFYNSKEQIREFLDSGYSVVGFCMPLLGLNNQPTVQLPRQGKLKLTTHDHMKLLSPVNGHPVKYFIEPVVIVLNYLEKNYDYSSLSMVGISGGGWTTTLASAIDSRIDKSFPVAGSYPIYLRSNSQRDWGDYEQIAPKIYNTVNYLELYILGSVGANRKQLQIINQYDSCCFAGTKWETYKDIVRERVHEFGAGEYDLFMDTTHREHLVSEAAMRRILDELGNNTM